jgi:hypothetical protein
MAGQKRDFNARVDLANNDGGGRVAERSGDL